LAVQITTLSENTAGTVGVLAEWGLSILIETGGCTVLLDTGAGVSAAHNAVTLGVDLSRIDRIVFSHGHFDHTGGLPHLLRMMRRGVEVIAHPDMWAAKYAGDPERQMRYIGVPFAREAAETLGASFLLEKDPVWISDDVVASGEIPMITNYETIDPVFYVKERGEVKPDSLLDDQAVFVRSERGLIVIAGCAHRGIVNTIKHGRSLTGMAAVYAVIGGTHLISASRQRLEATIRELSGFGIQRLGVSHCTGLPVSATLARMFGDAFFFNNAGTMMTI
jgi:7,8-dihydropterin-6-yl-methyl-4-(beta-D-ribofuranosyl)aminobenzene 5'-phosphate synthase